MKPYVAPAAARRPAPAAVGRRRRTSASSSATGSPTLRASQQLLSVDRLADPEAFRDYFKTNYGPTIAAYRGIAGRPGAHRRARPGPGRPRSSGSARRTVAMGWEYLLGRRDEGLKPGPTGTTTRRIRSDDLNKPHDPMDLGPATYEIAGPDAFRDPGGGSSISASMAALRSSGRERRAHGGPGQVGDSRRSSRSSSRAATSYSWLRLVPNIDGSSEFTVTVTPASRNALIGCSSRLGTARVAMLDDGQTSSGMPGLGEVVEQLRVLRRRGAVTDPLGAEQAQGRPRSSPGRWSRRRGARCAARPAGRVEVRLELRRAARPSRAHPARSRPARRRGG